MSALALPEEKNFSIKAFRQSFPNRKHPGKKEFTIKMLTIR